MAVEAPSEPLRQVFVSHAAADEDATVFASSVLKPALEAAGVNVFLDFTSLTLGIAWQQELLKAAAYSAVVVVLASPTYTRRFWCMQELDVALNGMDQPRSFKPTIIPVFLESPASLGHEKVEQFWAAQLPELPPERQAVVDAKRWAANIKQLPDLTGVRLLEAGVGKDWWWQAAHDVVKAALHHLPHASGALSGFDEQADILEERLARSGMTGLWLHGPGVCCVARTSSGQQLIAEMYQVSRRVLCAARMCGLGMKWFRSLLNC
jgi:hypothetical protein